MGYYISNNELYHFGIKGQKWGIRRYQNADGSLTSAGRKRYGIPDWVERRNQIKAQKAQAKEERKAARKAEKEKNWSDDYKRYRELKKKKYYEMTNAEISELESLEGYQKKNRTLKPGTVAKAVAVLGTTAATMAAVNSFISTSKTFNKNMAEIGGSIKNSKAATKATNAIVDSIGDIIMSDLNKSLSKPFT